MCAVVAKIIDASAFGNVASSGTFFGAGLRAQETGNLHAHTALVASRVYEKLHFGSRVPVNFSRQIIKTHRLGIKLID